ncbi:anthranilate N-methyltransferase-like [Castanea sativa]|uniref:anthranilate N-methyltransferase-like n=1 Tax=Castanea sativa TaxID=21020 RepID=UPI003F653E53
MATAAAAAAAAASSSSAQTHIFIDPTTIIDNQEPQRIQRREEEEAFSEAVELVYGSMLPMAIHTAIDLGVFDILANVGSSVKLSAEEIVAQMPTTNPDAPAMINRICSLLVHHGVLGVPFDDDTSRRRYCLTSVSKYFARGNQLDGVSLAPLMDLVHDKVYLDSWSQLKNAILEGGLPFNKVHGMHAYEHAGRDGRFSQVFNTAMFSHAAIVVKKILESSKGFENLKQVVDVGGGIGVALNLITSKYPNIKGINFDLPHVIKHAPPFPGVKHVAGDMFESVPKGDAIFLNGILRDWSDNRCLKLLKNCYNSLPKDGKVIVVEQILPTYPEMTTTARGKSLLDMLMMTQKPGGKVRMQHELVDLAYGAGFKTICFTCSVCNSVVMEFIKKDMESVSFAL